MLHTVAGILLVANATSLGWGLRGEWGHWWGATVPGALCGMSIWLAFGQSSSAWQMLAYGAVLAVSLSLGGVLSYGLIVGYATAEKGRDSRSPLFGLFGLFLVGGLWGFFGGTALGLLMTDISYKIADLALWAVLASLGAFMAYKLLVIGLDLHLSPPRSDAWAAVLGGAIASATYFALGPGDSTVLIYALSGWLGFGGGFALGAYIHRKGKNSLFKFSSWKFMEHSVGFFGGLALGISAALSQGGVPPVEMGGRFIRPSILVVFWFMTYMVLSNNLEHWTFEIKWLSRRVFTVFQVLSLFSLLIFLYLTQNLLVSWEGSNCQAGVFLLLMLLFTIIGTVKFMHRWSDIRSRVVYTFVVQFLVCVVLLLLL